MVEQQWIWQTSNDINSHLTLASYAAFFPSSPAAGFARSAASMQKQEHPALSFIGS
jgi:hypothetical protein